MVGYFDWTKFQGIYLRQSDIDYGTEVTSAPVWRTFGMMKRWPTLVGDPAPSLGTFIGRNTAGFGVGLFGWGVYDLTTGTTASEAAPTPSTK